MECSICRKKVEEGKYVRIGSFVVCYDCYKDERVQKFIDLIGWA